MYNASPSLNVTVTKLLDPVHSTLVRLWQLTVVFFISLQRNTITHTPLRELTIQYGTASPYHLVLNSTMATGGENFNPAYEAFRKHSADLLTVMQDPEVLAWELYSKGVVSSAVVEFANNMTHERGERTSKMLMAVGSQIKVDPGAFDVFLSVLAKRPSTSDLCRSMKDACSKSVGQTSSATRGKNHVVS